ncbi:MAG: EAL domain-containing protein [Pseudomonadota bacterium]
MPLRRLLRVAVLAICAAPSMSLAVEFTAEELAFIAENPVIRVGGETDWPPLDFVDDAGYTGVGKDFLDEISARTGIKIEMVTGYSWVELLDLLRSREIDMLPVMYWTEQRGREFNLTNPYLAVRYYVFARAGSGYQSFEQLKGKKLAVPSGYNYITYLEENHPDVHILEVASNLDAMDAVLTGKAEGLIENLATIAYLSEQQTILGLEAAFSVKDAVNNVHMGIRSDWPILRDIVQKALADIPQSRSTQIMSAWTGNEANARAFLTNDVVLSAEENTFLREKQQIGVCINASRMPIEGKVQDRHDGMTADFFNLIAENLRVGLRHTVYSSRAQLLEHMNSGACDVVGLSFLSEQIDAQGWAISAPYIERRYAIATLTNEPYYHSLGDLADVRIAFVDAYIDREKLESTYSRVDFVSFESLTDALESVQSGQVYAVLDDLPVLSHAVLNGYENGLKVSGGNVEGLEDYRVAIRDEQPLLVSSVVKAVDAIPAVTRQNIYRKWAAVSIQRRTDYGLAIKLAVGFLVMLLLIVFRYRELRSHRRQMQKKNAELQDINSQLEEKTDSAMHMAYHDQLTGLPNRAKLMVDIEHAMKRARRAKQQLAVLFLDLDRFKIVNDTLGHDVGDELLQQVTARIRGLLRDTDILCRLGGDEFIVLLDGMEKEYVPQIVAQRIIETLNVSFSIEEHEVNIGSSIGIAVYPDDAIARDTLLKCADSAMYSAKDGGRNTFCFYREEIASKADRRLSIESALRRSLSEQDFSLVFQPIVDVLERKVVKAEALIRWRHKELGMIPPDEFIPIAEEFGMIVELGEWVLRKTCEAIRQFSREGCNLKTVALNVSSVEFVKGDLAKRYEEIVPEYGVSPSEIDIEITERYMLDKCEGTESELQKLRSLGHNICVDDFGTGYSSLSYMKRLPLNVIKIDRSFIQNVPHDQNDIAISKAIINLSHALGYKVVAEGVETQEQLDFLTDEGCDFAQGYYLSRPVPASEFKRAVDQINGELNIEKSFVYKIRKAAFK